MEILYTSDWSQYFEYANEGKRGDKYRNNYSAPTLKRSGIREIIRPNRVVCAAKPSDTSSLMENYGCKYYAQPIVEKNPQKAPPFVPHSPVTSFKPRNVRQGRLLSISKHSNILLFFTSLISVHLCLPETSASPITIPGSLIHIHRRQAIPDSTGNTGNVPAPAKSSLSPPRPVTSIIVTPSSSATPLPTPTLLPSPSSSTARPNSSTPPADELRLTRTSAIISPGTLAGIITGGSIALLLILALGFFLLRRRRRQEISEIPIRRSKLGSHLRHRMFNSPLPPSRSISRSSGRTLTGDGRRTWPEKEIIGRPDAMRSSEGAGEGKRPLLSVPRAAFMKIEGENMQREGGERWVGWEISRPRPVRPASAEPLGRLSGMGMGMGYLK